MALAQMLKSPIVHAFGGKEFVEYDNPFDVGMTGLIGFSSGYHAMLDCDTLLMLGTDFPYRQFFPTNAKIVKVDLRPENLGQAHAARPRPGGRCGSHDQPPPAAQASTLGKVDRHLDDSLANYRAAREGLDEFGDLEAGPQAHSPAVARPGDQRAGQPTMQCSPSTSARRQSGRRAI